MKPTTRWLLIVIAGLLLLAAPALVRTFGLGYNQRTYQAPSIAGANLAATPIPTPTPVAQASPVPLPDNELRRGPVVVDLAHVSLIDRDRFQPLAAAIAIRGLDLRYWLPTEDISNVRNITSFPDQSELLEEQLADASALIVVSPFFMYSPQEVAVVEQFVSDGGRLLVISDPDIESDAARDTNSLASTFNIVFNEDFLYDTVDNDENYTYFFQGDFLDRAEQLEGSRIAFYGGRSIGGAVVPQLRSTATTLSSMRNGLTSFNTVVLGGLVANNTIGRVLGMSDFDVLTDPYVARHDNRRLLEFVADFLAGAQRANTIADFPAFLGKQVALVIDNTQPVGANGLSKAAELQRVLELSGRTLSLAPNSWLTDPNQGTDQDLIYVAGYRAADDMTPLLQELGIDLVEELVTPTATPTPVAEEQDQPPPAEATPAPDERIEPERLPIPDEPTTEPIAPPELTPPLPVTPLPEATPLTVTTGLSVALVQTQVQTATLTPPPTATPAPTPSATSLPSPTPASTTPPTPLERVPITATVTQTSTTIPLQEMTGEAAPPATPTPEVRLFLERKDGIRLVADETQLFIQRPYHNFQRILAVLANSEEAINAGLTRLLNRDFAGCLAQNELVICPYSGPADTSQAQATAPAAPVVAPGERADAASVPTMTRILVVDDNLGAEEGEKSEAAIYLTVLSAAGHQVEHWVTSDQGVPDATDLAKYDWVVWSDASYKTSGIDGEALRVISAFINDGGHITISSRMPFFGVGGEPPSPIADIVVAGEIPELVEGLPEEPIVLTEETPPLTPLEMNPDPSTSARIALARGPASESSGAPVLVLYSDENFEEPKGALMLLFGMSMGWLPPDISEQLILNMVQVMAP
jgi:hypothetical protein